MTDRRRPPRTWRQVALRRWPRALWIRGSARYAAWSVCDGYVSVTLTATREQAQRLVREECGADNCGPGRHTVVDLTESPGGAALAQQDAERPRRRDRPHPSSPSSTEEAREMLTHRMNRRR
jgi:hypothetical protein